MMTMIKYLNSRRQPGAMIDQLMALGLTENESRVYEGLMDLGLTPAGNIIKRINLHRNIVYDNLEKLIKKGLVSFVTIRDVKHFEIAQPEELAEYVDSQKKELVLKEKALREILPTIKKRRKLIHDSSEASIFKGRKGLKNVFEQFITEKKELVIFATGWGMKKIMGSYYAQWHLKLKQGRIPGRAIVSRSMKQAEEFPYKIRYLPEQSILPSTILVQGTKIVNVIWEDEPLVIIIKNKKLADSYRTYFELLWKKGE